jgi:tRNA(fMet)-specific endonuclease VapC
VLLDYGDEPIAIAAVTASELLHGVHRAVEPSQRSRREAFVERLLEALPVLPFDLVVARAHARLSAQLAMTGVTVGSHDLLIAATAVAVGYDVATRDERSFPRIPGLNVLRW